MQQLSDSLTVNCVCSCLSLTLAVRIKSLYVLAAFSLNSSSQMKKPQPRQGSTFPSSPLTTAHIHASRNPRGHYHTQVDNESSSNSAFEEDEEQDIKRKPEVGASPQRKVPLLPPSHPPVVTSRQSHPPVVTSRQAQPPKVRVKRQATSLLERVHIELTVKM